MDVHRLQDGVSDGLRLVFNALPPRVKALATRANRLRPGNRAVWGNMRRTEPFSKFSGFDRGTPVDRPLIEGFLDRHRALIRGRVLEVKSPEYARRFGGAAVTEEVVVDIDPSNGEATFIADLCIPGSLAEVTVDCVILTQTLQFLPSPEKALANVWSVVAPGGSILLTVPCVAGVDPWLAEHDYWRYTASGLRKLAELHCPGAHVVAEAHGNVLLCAGFLYGLAAEEFEQSEYVPTDPNCALISSIVITRPATT